MKVNREIKSNPVSVLEPPAASHQAKHSRWPFQAADNIGVTLLKAVAADADEKRTRRRDPSQTQPLPPLKGRETRNLKVENPKASGKSCRERKKKKKHSP